MQFWHDRLEEWAPHSGACKESHKCVVYDAAGFRETLEGEARLEQPRSMISSKTAEALRQSGSWCRPGGRRLATRLVGNSNPATPYRWLQFLLHR